MSQIKSTEPSKNGTDQQPEPATSSIKSGRNTKVLNGRVILGDCLKVMREMNAGSVDLVLTDPPYAINYRSNRRIAKPRFDHLNGDQPGDWIEQFALEAFRLLKMNRHLYCFCRHDTYPRFYQAFEGAGFTMKRTLIWVKNNHGSGDLKGDYASRDEWIIFAQKGRRLMQGKRRDNIFEYDKVHSSQLLHPTQKPIDLLRVLIEKSTERGELVLDPYAGVLSTALAAMEENRNFIMIDIEESFLRKGWRRFDEALGKQKYHLEIPSELHETMT